MTPPSRPRRIAIVIPALSAGGAERVASVLVRAWAERGWSITILTFDDGAQPPFFALPPGIEIRPLDLMAGSGGSLWRGLKSNWWRIRVLRRAVRAARPDLVLSFIDRINVIVLLALFGTGLKTAVWENTDPLSARGNRYVTNWARRMAPLVYRLADAVVAQTDAAADYLARGFGSKAIAIPNAVLPPAAVEPMKLERPAVIGLGRLSPEKGFDVLLRAFGRIAVRFPDWRLYIFGEGPERKRLEALIEELGLVGRVLLPGVVHEPTAALRGGDLFVMPSHIEGFGLALCEAMACGLPSVATDCSSGPRSILRPEIDGLLVPPADDEKLADAMARLMGDGTLRARFAARAPEVVERFSLESVLARWDALFARMRGETQAN